MIYFLVSYQNDDEAGQQATDKSDEEFDKLKETPAKEKGSPKKAKREIKRTPKVRPADTVAVHPSKSFLFFF